MVLHHVVVVGATGNLGPSIVNALLERKDYFTSITAVTHSDPLDKKFDDIKQKGVKVVHAKFDDKHSLAEAFKGADAVISTVGGGAFDSQTTIVDAAVEAGVKRFVPSEFGVDTTDPKFAAVPIFAAKVAVHKHTEELAKAGKITYTDIITGPFGDWGLRVGFTGFNLQKQEATIWDGGHWLTNYTNVQDIGRFTAAALVHSEISSNKTLRFSSYVATQHQVLQALEKESGKQWTVLTRTTADSEHKAQEAFEKKDIPTFVAESIRAVLFNGKALYGNLDNSLFPEVKTTSLDETVRAVLHEAKSH